jgi:hypothetical protein
VTRTKIVATAAVAGALGVTGGLASGREAPWAAPEARPPMTAAASLVAEVEAKAAGRWRTAWSTLYPLHQRVAARETFVHCETATPFPARLESVRVVRAVPAAVEVAGVPHALRGAAVTVDVELRAPELSAPFSFRQTFHLVRVGGDWRWLLSPSRYRLYRRHGCGEAPAL